MRDRMWPYVMCLLLVAVSAPGQVNLKLEIDPDTVLLHEPLVARVAILNNGAAPLTINGANGAGPQLHFSMEHNDGSSVVRRQGRALKALTLQPGQVRILEDDLTMRFAMTRAGRYFVRARLSGGAVEEARSSLKVVDVVPGMELVRKVGNVPGAPGQRRTYSLRYWARNQKDHVFLCVSDAPSGMAFAPIHLGALIRVVRPSLVLGEHGAVIVKHQVNRSQMIKSTIRSQRDKVSLVSQRVVRVKRPARPSTPTLPKK